MCRAERLEYMYYPLADLFWESGNLDLDPLFSSGPEGNHYLSQTASGQPSDSPCFDSGSDMASEPLFRHSGRDILHEWPDNPHGSRSGLGYRGYGISLSRVAGTHCNPYGLIPAFIMAM